MPECEFIINDPIGIHSRPANVFARKAREFQAKLELHCNGKSANAKSMLALMSLGVTSRQTVRLTAEGADALEALHTLEQLAGAEFNAESVEK